MTMKNKGGRPATGTVVWRFNVRRDAFQWYARVSLADGSRPLIELDPSIPRDDLARAHAAAKEASDYGRSLGYVPVKVHETVREWFARFHTHKAERGLSSVDDMRSRAKNWILPTIGEMSIDAVQKTDIERIVALLDRAVLAFQRRGRGKGRLSPSTAKNVWGDLRHAFDECVRAKDPGLRALTADPTRDARGPETGDVREGPILYGDEIVTLLSCVDVPLYRRRVYAVALYTAARRSELAALMSSDVDVKHLTITISKQIDRKSGAKKLSKQTKTRKTRNVDIEPHLWPLIELLLKEGAPKLLRVPPAEDCADLLRKDLRTAGVDRAELYLEDQSRTPIWFHHLRDTCLTHMAVRRDHATIIQWRAGHTDYRMTSAYVDRGRTEARRIGTPLPPLPLVMLQPWEGQRVSQRYRPEPKLASVNPLIAYDNSRSLRELNWRWSRRPVRRHWNRPRRALPTSPALFGSPPKRSAGKSSRSSARSSEVARESRPDDGQLDHLGSG